MTLPPPAGFAFDAFGTLFDQRAAAGALAGATADPDAFAAAWRARQLDYTLRFSLMERYVDFHALTLDALAATCEQFEVVLDEPQREAATRAFWSLPAFPDVRPGLERLRRIAPCAILSNGTRAMLDHLVERARLELDDVLSVEPVRRYKPAPEVYRLAADRFGCEPGGVVLVSSNHWDVCGGLAFGLRGAWVNRRRAHRERLRQTEEWTGPDLLELAAAFEGRPA